MKSNYGGTEAAVPSVTVKTLQKTIENLSMPPTLFEKRNLNHAVVRASILLKRMRPSTK